MTNRNPVKQLFITFPHSTVDKSEFRDVLLRFEPEYYKVCEEQHKDGTPHLHAVIKFKNKFSKAYVLKYFKEQYPDDYKRIDVAPVRSIKKSIEYLSKEDENPLVSGEYNESRNPQRNWRDSFARDLGYRDSQDLVTIHTEEVLLKAKLLAECHSINLKYLHDYNEFPDLPFSIKNILRKLDCNISISKDDITFIKKYYKIG